jgi:hypothetical protein
MIFLTTWSDGRQIALRASDEEQARIRSQEWRTTDSDLELGTAIKPARIEVIQTRGPVGILLAGWENP